MKNEKGAITLVTLGTVIFMMAFLLSSFIIISNRLQAQTEIKRETKKIYESDLENVEKIYKTILSKGNKLGGIRVTKNTEYKSDGKTAIIPAGFTASGLINEQSIDNGLVIYLIPEEIGRASCRERVCLQV